VQRHTSPAPAAAPAKKSKAIRWHFGIRSRSEPLEVMLEIYRTLKTLGFEWKEKEPEKRIDMADYADDFDGHSSHGHGHGGHHGEDRSSSGGGSSNGHGYAPSYHTGTGSSVYSGVSGTSSEKEAREEARKRKRREEEEFVKKAQALFFIETRCRVDDVIVRMDLQLYSIDKENYLVDFRNLGYRTVRHAHPEPSSTGSGGRKGVSFAGAGGEDESEASGGSDFQTFAPGSPYSTEGDTGPPPSSAPRSRQPSIDPMGQAGSSFSHRQLWEAAAKARTHSHGASPGGTHPGQSLHQLQYQQQQQQRPQARRTTSHKSADMMGGNISSPFLFLECACKLIVELGGLTLNDRVVLGCAALTSFILPCVLLCSCRFRMRALHQAVKQPLADVPLL
jgi:carbon catabolite-derepressing protein kinase